MEVCIIHCFKSCRDCCVLVFEFIYNLYGVDLVVCVEWAFVCIGVVDLCDCARIRMRIVRYIQ